jgi:hypothetical protein
MLSILLPSIQIPPAFTPTAPTLHGSPSAESVASSSSLKRQGEDLDAKNLQLNTSSKRFKTDTKIQ